MHLRGRDAQTNSCRHSVRAVHQWPCTKRTAGFPPATRPAGPAPAAAGGETEGYGERAGSALGFREVYLDADGDDVRLAKVMLLVSPIRTATLPLKPIGHYPNVRTCALCAERRASIAPCKHVTDVGSLIARPLAGRGRSAGAGAAAHGGAAGHARVCARPHRLHALHAGCAVVMLVF